MRCLEGKCCLQDTYEQPFETELKPANAPTKHSLRNIKDDTPEDCESTSAARYNNMQIAGGQDGVTCLDYNTGTNDTLVHPSASICAPANYHHQPIQGMRDDMQRNTANLTEGTGLGDGTLQGTNVEAEKPMFCSFT